jgi:putative solute:sodium symporter small subunit
MRLHSPPSATPPGQDGASQGPDSPRLPKPQPLYWRRNLGLVASLLLLWFVVTFLIAFHARDLAFDFFGWPFSFWVGAQGALVTYWFITAVYARSMNRLEKRQREDEGN